MKYSSLKLSILLSLLILTTTPVAAQKSKKKKEEDKKEEKAPEKKKPKKISEAIKGSNKVEGLFTLYQDSINGNLTMIIREDQLDQEFIHFYYVENGVLESNAIRGQYRGSKIIKLTKYYNRIEFTIQNTSYYFDPELAISKASEANISSAVIYSTEIKAGSVEEKAYLIEVDKLFLSDALGFIKRPSPEKPDPKAFNLGKLSSDKTKYAGIRNYPENLDVIVDYVYENSEPKNFGSDAVADARFVTIKVQHSLIAVPQNDFEPRFDDPRVGYFTSQVTDLTSKSPTPYRDLIHRWNLVKKYPDSTLSEPVEPIVWWIENTTPIEIRPTIKAAALNWNLAFEKAGFKNAVVIKEQPDDADWDAGDIRYNVLRWTSSPDLAFGGYGPHFTNPRTGQVLGADIMLEYAVIGYRLRADRLFKKLNNGELNLELFSDENRCLAAAYSQLENSFGLALIDALDKGSEEEKIRLLDEFLYFLILHELGHTLGLNHNMMSSQLHSMHDIQNTKLTNEVGLTGSVMDYPAVNFALDRDNQGQYYTMRPGPYDLWEIEYDYQRATKEELELILSRSTEPQLMFGNDADDMRAAGRGIDPRINVSDLSSDAIEYAIERIKLGETVSKELLKKYGEDNTSYHDLRGAFYTTSYQKFSAAEIISRYVGGVYIDRAFIGQEGATKPFIPVEKEIQKKAIKALNDYIFAPNAFASNDEIYNYLQRQRRGFDHYGTPEDPRLHNSFLSTQKAALDHLLHPNVLNRIVDSELYGNEYVLSSMMTDLQNGIFGADASSSVNSFRQNIQVEYVSRLITIVKDKKSTYLPRVQSMAYYNLKASRNIAAKNIGDLSTRAHRQYLVYLIDQALDAD